MTHKTFEIRIGKSVWNIDIQIPYFLNRVDSWERGKVKKMSIFQDRYSNFKDSLEG